jgi:Tfp pilus assembly protein FimV
MAVHMAPADAFRLEPFQPTTSPALRLLPAPTRMPLRVRPRISQAPVYRRRRALALASLATVTVVIVLLVGAISTRLAGGGHPSTAVGAPSRIASAEWVVQPGDTLWSIAAELAPDVDPRATVDRLVEANGNEPLQVGQRLVMP